MPNIKVLHIIKSLGRGGAEMLLPETLKIHNKSEYEFHYVYFLPWKNQMVDDIEKAGGRVKCFKAKNNLELLLRAKKVIDYCKENNIDIIHCHLPWAGFLGRFVHYKTKIPLLYSEHNMQERYHQVTKHINKLTFNFQSLAIGVSNDVSDSIRRNVNPEIPVQTILNGVNTNSFVRTNNSKIRKQYNIPEDAIVFGNVAVFRFQKRLVEWLKVFKRIHLGNNNVYGIIVGAGPLEFEIMQVLKDLNLEDRVFFPGLKTNVKPYFEAMDIFMMSSSFEGLPIALLEAMSMECAVISTNAGGIKEVIRNNEDGMLCNVENWRELSSIGNNLINDPAKLKDLKIAARQRVVEAFSLKTMVCQLEKSYVQFSNKN